jgi:hypothetical protein
MHAFVMLAVLPLVALADIVTLDVCPVAVNRRFGRAGVTTSGNGPDGGPGRTGCATSTNAMVGSGGSASSCTIAWLSVGARLIRSC